MSIIRYDINMIKRIKTEIHTACPTVHLAKRKDMVNVVVRLDCVGIPCVSKITKNFGCKGRCTKTDCWLCIDFVFPGITKNRGYYSPLILCPHCSIYIKKQTRKWRLEVCELPDLFWKANQHWFDKNDFLDVLFGFREHDRSGAKPVVTSGDMNEMHYRPARVFNASNVDLLTKKVIYFLQVWGNVGCRSKILRKLWCWIKLLYWRLR